MKIFLMFLFLLGMVNPQMLYAASDKFIVLDVRTSAEFETAHVKDAVNIDVMATDFGQRLSKLDKSKPYKVYCRSGNRSGRAVQLMKSMGFTDVENIGGLKQAEKRLNRACEGTAGSC